MNPLGAGSAWARAFTAPRPCPLRAGGGGGERRQQQRPGLGASPARLAAGLAVAASGLPPLAAAAGYPARRPSGDPSAFGSPARRTTDFFLVANVLLYGLQVLTKEALTVWGVKFNAAIIAGQYWRLLTPAFLHGNIMHLVVNSYSLNNLGPAVEATAGHGRFLAMYLTAAVAGNVASFVFSPSPSLGASGAIFGLGGALAMYFYRNRDVYGKRSDYVLKQLQSTLLVNLVYGFSSPRVDNWGHLGGLVGGALAALLVGPVWKARRLPGKKGEWMVDVAPLPWFRSEPRQVR